ncbi:mCG1048587 [Mus musculus]|nr:mCG1048587 [Mus musculus]
MFLDFIFLSVLFFGMGQAPPLVQTLGSSADLKCASASKETMAEVSSTLREVMTPTERGTLAGAPGASVFIQADTSWMLGPHP